jgi:hypothetical protein
VSLNGTVGETNPRSTGVAQVPGLVRRTAINLSGGVNELADRTVCSVDTVTGRESVHIGNPGILTYIAAIKFIMPGKSR